MPAMRRRSLVAVAALMLTILPACQFAKVGARCNPAQGAARNNTHVLFCTKGRWKASLTIGQAAEIIMSTWPGAVNSVRGTEFTVPAGGAIPQWLFLVTTRGGNPAAGAEVRLSAPGLFAGADELRFTADASGRVDLDGAAQRFTTTPGQYLVQVSSGPLPNVLATLKVTVEPSTPASMAVVSGNHQRITAGGTFQPWVVQVKDAHGNPVPGIKFSTTMDGLNGSLVIVDNAGTYSFTAPQQFVADDYTLRFWVNETSPSGAVTTLTSVEFRAAVDPGPLADALVTGDDQSATVNTEFARPIQVMGVDAYLNPVPGTAVDLTIIPGPAGAAGVVSSSNTLFGTGLQAFITANGNDGSWTARVSVEGIGTADLQMTNVQV